MPINYSMKRIGAKYLYQGFRKFIEESRLNSYDNAYFSKQRPRPKFMIALIHEYVDIETQYNDICSKDPALIAYFQNEYCFKSSSLSKVMKTVKETKRHQDIQHLFKF